MYAEIVLNTVSTDVDKEIELPMPSVRGSVTTTYFYQLEVSCYSYNDVGTVVINLLRFLVTIIFRNVIYTFVWKTEKLEKGDIGGRSMRANRVQVNRLVCEH